MSAPAPIPGLVAALERIGPRDHLCSIYESREEQFATAIAFMQIGLARGEKCIYLADDDNEEAVRGAMSAAGIDVEHAVSSNALVLTTKARSYLQHGSFDPARMLAFWADAGAQAAREGFAALRVTGETDWVAGGAAGIDRWFEYESRLTHAMFQNDCFALCQYNRALFPPALILDVIRTHPMVIYRGTVCRNPYHVPPDEFLAAHQPAHQVERLLSNMREREQAEQARNALRESEQRFRLMVEGVKDYAIFSLDVAGRVSSWNRGAERIKGYRGDEILGRHFALFYPPEEAAQGDPAKHLQTAASAGTVEAEGWRIRKDGTRFWANILITALRDEHGALVGYSKLVRDFTERRRAEEALRATQADLARVSRMMTMGELTASIAHEVNQPLAAIVANGNACLRWLAGYPANVEEAREGLGRVIRDANRASEVLARIRAFVKKESPEKERVDMNEAIEQVIALARGELQRNRVVLRATLASDLPSVLGDRVQLQQVMLNLIMNAVESMSAVAGRARELLIDSREDEVNQVRVTVRDSGIGLEGHSMERIFQPFYTTKPQGTGIGLSISRSIVEAHCGRLWAARAEAPGATFQFTLPAYAAR